MLWSRNQWKAIKILASKYEVDYPQNTGPFYYDFSYNFLEVLERKLEIILAEKGEEYLTKPVSSEAALLLAALEVASSAVPF